MSINERPKWIIAAAAAIAATGVGGVVLASEGTGRSLPDSVSLQDGVPVASATFDATVSPFERTSPIIRAEDGSFTVSGDSLDTDNSLDTDSDDAQDSSVASVDTDSVDSPDVDADDSVTLDSPDDTASDDSI